MARFKSSTQPMTGLLPPRNNESHLQVQGCQLALVTRVPSILLYGPRRLAPLNLSQLSQPHVRVQGVALHVGLEGGGIRMWTEYLLY